MEYKEFAQRLFAVARQEGCQEFECYMSTSESFRAGAYEGTVEDYRVNTSIGASFRVKVNGHMGYAYSERLDEETARLLVLKAKENAGVIQSEDPEFIFPGSEKYPDVEGPSAAITALTADWKINRALELEAAAKAASPLVRGISHCVVSTSQYAVYIANSAGMMLEHEGNALVSYVVPVLEQDDRMETGLAYRCLHNPEELDVQALAREAVDNALAKLGASSIASGKYAVAMLNMAATDMLETFSGVFNADSAQRGLSRLKDKEGAKIAADCVTLVDDPLLPGGFATRPFDDEGVAAQAHDIIEKGTLKTLLHNLKTAAKQGGTTTGNAAKAGLSAPVGVEPTNFYFCPSQTGKDELLRTMGEGLLITEVEGLHAGANAVTGDFSLSARGFVIHEGKQGRAVNQITIAGNFYAMLQDIKMVASDLRFGMPGNGCCGSPTLWIGSLDVAGA